MKNQINYSIDSTPVKNLAEYLNITKKIQKKFSTKNETILPWFRGHNRNNYKLKPGLYRGKYDPLDKLEYQYRHDFKLKAYPYIGELFKEPVNDWEWYFVMQHYGLPTRLIDWSEGSLIALHFALNGSKNSINPCVWVLNPHKLNKKVAQKDDIIITHEYKMISDYLPNVWSSERIPSRPVAIQPPFHSKRIGTQKGCFTLHGSDTRGIEEFEEIERCLYKIEINKRNVFDIKDELMLSGVTESLIYPELSGLCKELVDFWK